MYQYQSWYGAVKCKQNNKPLSLTKIYILSPIDLSCFPCSACGYAKKLIGAVGEIQSTNSFTIPFTNGINDMVECKYFGKFQGDIKLNKENSLRFDVFESFNILAVIKTKIYQGVE